MARTRRMARVVITDDGYEHDVTPDVDLTIVDKRAVTRAPSRLAALEALSHDHDHLDVPSEKIDPPAPVFARTAGSDGPWTEVGTTDRFAFSSPSPTARIRTDGSADYMPDEGNRIVHPGGAHMLCTSCDGPVSHVVPAGSTVQPVIDDNEVILRVTYPAVVRLRERVRKLERFAESLIELDILGEDATTARDEDLQGVMRRRGSITLSSIISDAQEAMR